MDENKQQNPGSTQPIPNLNSAAEKKKPTPAQRRAAQLARIRRQKQLRRQRNIRIAIVVLALVVVVGFSVGLVHKRLNKQDAQPLAETSSDTTMPASGTPDESTDPSATDPSESETGESIANVVPTDETTSELTTETNEKTNRIVVDVTREDFNFVVVNSGREMPEGYVPQLSYILTSIYGYNYQLDYRVAPHYEEMYNAAKKDGITLTPYSAYRSYDRQKRNYENRAANEHAKGLSWDEAYAEAAKVILPPGTSEHNLGFAMDVCNVYDSFANQPEYAWLMEHAHEYGFILRYTAEKQPITGIVPEPWHWRYVGVPYAQQIKESGLCLEEWLEQQGIPF